MNLPIHVIDSVTYSDESQLLQLPFYLVYKYWI